MDKKAHEALERIRKDVTLTTSDMENQDAAEFFNELADWAYANGEAMLIDDEPEKQDEGPKFLLFIRIQLLYARLQSIRCKWYIAFILYFQLSWVSLYLPKAMYHLHRMDCSLAQYGSSHSTVKVRFSSVR